MEKTAEMRDRGDGGFNYAGCGGFDIGGGGILNYVGDIDFFHGESNGYGGDH